MLIEVLIFCHEKFGARFGPVKKQDNIDSHDKADYWWDIFFALEVDFLNEIVHVRPLSSCLNLPLHRFFKLNETSNNGQDPRVKRDTLFLVVMNLPVHHPYARVKHIQHKEPERGPKDHHHKLEVN